MKFIASILLTSLLSTSLLAAQPAKCQQRLDNAIPRLLKCTKMSSGLERLHCLYTSSASSCQDKDCQLWAESMAVIVEHRGSIKKYFGNKPLQASLADFWSQPKEHQQTLVKRICATSRDSICEAFRIISSCE